MCGLAGIGYQLLRFTLPENVPSLLLLEARKSAMPNQQIKRSGTAGPNQYRGDVARYLEILRRRGSRRWSLSTWLQAAQGSEPTARKEWAILDRFIPIADIATEAFDELLINVVYVSELSAWNVDTRSELDSNTD